MKRSDRSRKSTRKSGRKSGRKSSRKSNRKFTKMRRLNKRKSTRKYARKYARKSTRKYNGKQMGGVNPTDTVDDTNSQEVTSLLINKAEGLISGNKINRAVMAAMGKGLTFQALLEEFNNLVKQRLINRFNKKADGIISDKEINEAVMAAMDKGLTFKALQEKFEKKLNRRQEKIDEIVDLGYDRGIAQLALKNANYKLETVKERLEALKQEQSKIERIRDKKKQRELEMVPDEPGDSSVSPVVSEGEQLARALAESKAMGPAEENPTFITAKKVPRKGGLGAALHAQDIINQLGDRGGIYCNFCEFKNPIDVKECLACGYSLL